MWGGKEKAPLVVLDFGGVVHTHTYTPTYPHAQFNMAKLIPGKEEFHETIRYFKTRLGLLGVDVRLGTRVTAVRCDACCCCRYS